MSIARRALLALCLLALPALAGEAKPVTDRWYVWHVHGAACGYLHVVQTAAEAKDAPILLTHEFVASHRGKRVSLTMHTHCKQEGDCLLPVKIISKGEGDDELGTFEATVEWQASGDGVLRTEVRGPKVQLALPPRTVTDFALFEVVRRLPFREGLTLEFNSLEASELNLKRNHKVRYAGKQSVAVAGKTRPLHKFEHTGDGIRPAYYWVDDDHELVGIVIDDRKELLLATKDEAVKAAESPQPPPK